ncbi:MAG: lactonase family protein [Methylophilaceae bacterium]
MMYAKNIISLMLTLISYGVSADPLVINNTPQYSTYLVGTYTDAKNQGIELLSFNEDFMVLSSKVIASGINNPSFVVTNRARTLIFAVESTVDGKVSTFSFNQNQQSLTLLNKVESFGDHPCYIALDNSERFLAVANYASGNFSIYEIGSEGNLHFKQSVEHLGSSINKNRQNSAHVHSMVFHPNNKQLLVADLGTDKIYIYDVNFSNTKPATLANPAYFEVAAGAGPRHMVIHPNGKVLYVVHELTGEIGIYFYENGEITHAATQPLTTPKFKGQVQAAEVRISPDGKFVYVSNRGSANDISVFEVGLEGYLSLIQQISTGGKTPRNFNLSLDGHFLLAANQESDDIRVFQRDLLTGRLKTTSAKIKIHKPVYIFPFH